MCGGDRKMFHLHGRLFYFHLLIDGGGSLFLSVFNFHPANCLWSRWSLMPSGFSSNLLKASWWWMCSVRRHDDRSVLTSYLSASSLSFLRHFPLEASSPLRLLHTISSLFTRPPPFSSSHLQTRCYLPLFLSSSLLFLLWETRCYTSVSIQTERWGINHPSEAPRSFSVL